MRVTNLAAIGCLLTSLCAPALGDGVDLIAPTAARPADAAGIAALRDSEATRRVVGAFSVNRSALVSNILNVTIEGKTYRFARGQLPETGVPGVESWYGRTPAGETALISHDRKNGSLLAEFGIPRDTFVLRPVGSTYVLYATEPRKGAIDFVQKPKEQLPAATP